MQTRIQIVDLALTTAQLDSSYRVQGRQMLNILIDKLTRDFNWPFRRISYAAQAFSATSILLPTNYLKADNLFLYTQGQKSIEVKIVEPSIFDLAPTGYVGIPQIAMIATANPEFSSLSQQKNIVFNAIPATGSPYTWQLNYFRSSTDLSTDSADDGVVPDFEDQTVLIEELTAWAMKNADDQRYKDQKTEAGGVTRNAKINTYDFNSDSKMELNSSCFKTGRRYTRPFSWMGN